MRSKAAKIIALSISAVLLVFLVVVIGGTKYDELLHNGSFTAHVDPTPFVDSYHVIGIKNVHILNPEADSFSVMNIVLKDGIIDSIAPIDQFLPSVDYIDGKNKYLIPGLIDTHVHLLDSKNDLLLYLANGVTSVCEMFGKPRHLDWKKEQESGAISPYLYVASSKVMSVKGFFPAIEKYYGFGYQLATPEAARRGVRKFKADGYDAIKLAQNVDLEVYEAIADEAKKQNLPVIGHLPYKVGFNNLFKNGQSHLAHIEEVTKNMARDFGLNRSNNDAYLNYVRENADSIAVELRRHNISVSSTHWLIEKLPELKFHLNDYLRSIELRYANPGIVEGSSLQEGWLSTEDSRHYSQMVNDAEALHQAKNQWRTTVEANRIVVAALSRNNVMVVTGTDANVNGAIPGFSLHDELQALNNNGYTPTETLRAATIEAANFIKRKTGTIKTGLPAELILLSKNPLDDIKNTRSIEYVFFGKNHLNKVQIQRLLSETSSNNDNHRKHELYEAIN